MTIVKDQLKIEEYIRALEAYGFDMKPVWRDLSTRIEGYETGVPGEEDKQFLVPETAPSLSLHFVRPTVEFSVDEKDGKVMRTSSQKDEVEPGVLACHTMWQGYHYTLSPGQRRWFREFTGLTPAQTVTIEAVEVWPGTRHPRAFKVVSDQHTDPRNRKHVLKEWYVREPGKFFLTSAQFDAEEKLGKTLQLKIGKVNVWRQVHKWALEDCGGPSLKWSDRLEIADLTEDTIRFEEKYTIGEDTIVEVDRKQFLGFVADYENGTRVREKSESVRTVGGKRKSAEPAKSLDELMAELSSGLIP